MTATTAPAFTSTTVITARDFTPEAAHSVAWTAGALRHVIAALNGVPVAIVVDGQTGHTAIGAVLVGLRTAFSGHVSLVVRYPEGHETAHLVYALGETIIPLAETEEHRRNGGPKWEALKSYRAEKSAAVQRAQAEHGETEGRKWGVWEARPGMDGVSVSYTPSKGNPHFAKDWGTFGSWNYPIA